MTTPTVFELVRKDLLHMESEHLKRFGGPPDINGVHSEALLDAYDNALNLACELRMVIEHLTAGNSTFDTPSYGARA